MLLHTIKGSIYLNCLPLSYEHASPLHIGLPLYSHKVICFKLLFTLSALLAKAATIAMSPFRNCRQAVLKRSLPLWRFQVALLHLCVHTSY